MTDRIPAKLTRAEQAGRRLVRAIVGVALIAVVVSVVPVVGVCKPAGGTLLPLGPVMRFLAWVDPVFSSAPEVREMQRASRNRIDNCPLVQPNAMQDKQPQPQVGQLTAKQSKLLACKS
ncbi:MAG: hypothetical protein ACKVP0_03105 [Pirellulaceae bacterium]